MINKQVKTNELFSTDISFLKELFENSTYPWDILTKIKILCNSLINSGIEGFSEFKKGVLIGENVKIYDTATIESPCIIGNNTEIRPGAFIRGNVIIGSNCVIGNSTELKNSILLNNVQVPHYNYVGDSILGDYAHMGAGSICSNLKAGGSNVVIHGDEDYETGLRKIGAFIGEHGDIGCGSVLNPGTIIGKNSNIYPLTSVRGVIPGNSIVKSMDNIVSKNENS